MSTPKTFTEVRPTSSSWNPSSPPIENGALPPIVEHFQPVDVYRRGNLRNVNKNHSGFGLCRLNRFH
ncbi:MAG UNVERIFIED_CONTAM: hypothetical protein LVR18_35155 [Planctomycetaceae bacterium]